MPDGRRMIFAYGGSISSIDTATKKVTRIVRLRDVDMTGPGVSDDCTIAYNVVNDEEPDIWMLEAAHWTARMASPFSNLHFC